MTGIFAVDVFIAILTAIVIFAIPALFITRLVIDWLYPSLSHITCNDIRVYLMSEIKSDLDKLMSAPMGDIRAQWAREEALEKRITGSKKAIYPAKDTEMDLGYGLANDDSESRANEKPPCFLHACFRDKFPSEQERQEAIDKFIATIGDHGDTIFWRVRPELWEERSFEHDKIEYAAYFRFSVGYLPKE